MINPEALDLAVLEIFNRRLSHPLLDPFFVWLTDPPARVVLFAAAALLLFLLGGRKGRIALVTLAIAVAVSDQLSSSVLKSLFDRTRPCFAHPEQVRLLLHQAHSGSFPSSHAANGFAVAAVLFEVRRRLGWIALGLAALIAYSRVYVGVHYPSDLLAGAILGFAVGRLAVLGVRAVARLRKRRATVPAAAGAADPGDAARARQGYPGTPRG